MVKHLSSLLFVVLVATAILLIAGCGSGGNNGPTLSKAAFARYPSADGFTADQQQAFRGADLAYSLWDFDYPQFRSFEDIANSAEPVSYLANIEFPSTYTDFFPLGSPPASVVKTPTKGKSGLMEKNARALSRFAAAAVRNYMSGGREAFDIDFVSDYGVHWVGTFNYTETDTTVKGNLNVTGTDTVTGFVMVIKDSLSASQNDASTPTSMKYSFTYNAKLTGTVTPLVTSSRVASDVSAVIDADGSGSGSQKIDDFDNPTTLDSTYKSTHTAQVAVNDFVTYQSKYNENGTSHETELTQTWSDHYATDAWLYAEDGYWIHGTDVADMNQDAYDFTLNARASDGYTAAYTDNSGDGVGTIKDEDGNIIADLSEYYYTYGIWVDFIQAINDLGIEDTYINFYN